MQYHPEVGHSPHGQQVLRRFLYDVAGHHPGLDDPAIIDEQVAAIRAQVGDGRVICGLSGGVDSAVAAALVQRAVGDQLTCVFVDHGLLRAGEREQVERDYVAATGIRLVTVDARERFLTALAGVTDPETKRKIIGREFIRVFEARRRREPSPRPDGRAVKFLVQGTLYPDVVESGGGTGTATIKSHHNVGGLPDDLKFALVEPLRTLFKDEVRAVGAELGLPAEIVQRQPFPGPGLGIRIIGEVTARAARRAAGRRRDRPRGADRRRAGPRDLAVPGGAARRRPLASACRATAAPTATRSCCARCPVEDAMTADWTRLPYDVLAADLHPDHRRGARGQPGRAGRDQQAAGHHRVGVAGRRDGANAALGKSNLPNAALASLRAGLPRPPRGPVSCRRAVPRTAAAGCRPAAPAPPRPPRRRAASRRVEPAEVGQLADEGEHRHRQGRQADDQGERVRAAAPGGRRAGRRW